MRTKVVAMAALGAVAGLAAAMPASALNMITNGDFESGDTGFTSGYIDKTGDGLNSMYPEGTYAVGTDAAAYHNLWVSYGDHTSGKGNYLIVNGTTTDAAGTNIWESNLLTLGPGTYTFSAWTANSCCNSNFSGTNNPPALFFVGTNGTNDTPGHLNVVTGPTSGMWTETTVTFTLTGSLSGYAALRNNDQAASGNDFGLDDVSLVADVPEPASWAMMLAGFSVVGVSMRRRRNLRVAQAI